MDDYLISWNLIDAEGRIINHPQRNYPLGHNMWFKNYRLTRLKDSDVERLPDLRYVSSTIMKMVVDPASGGRNVFRYKGKQSPMNDRTPWSYLQWYPDGRAGQVPHHILMRFGANAPTGHPIRRPGLGCPRPIRYLLHRTDLLDPDEDPDTHHDICFFDVPVGIFWGMVGLRSLDRWWVVPSLIHDGDWLKTDPPRPGSFDPTPYQPVNATLPRGVYLKIRIAVVWDRPELHHSYFRFWPRGDIHIDDPADDDEHRADEDSDNDDDNFGPGPDQGGEQADSGEMQIVMYNSRSHEEQSVSRGGRHKVSKLFRHHNDNDRGYYGSPPYEDVRMMSPPPHENYVPVPPRRHNTAEEFMGTPTPPSIPESLRLEQLYISEEKLGPRHLILEQSKDDQKDLLRRGTGLGLNNLPSSIEEDLLPEMQSHRKGGSRSHYRDYDHRGYTRDVPGERIKNPEEDDEYYENEYSDDEYPEHCHPTRPRRDHPVAPGMGYEYPHSEVYHQNILHDAPREHWGYLQHRQDPRRRRKSEYSRHTEEEESFDESVGSPHAYITSRHPGHGEIYYERHEVEEIGSYNCRDSSPGRDYGDPDDESGAAILVAREEDEERQRRRRKKSAYQESYYRE
ncbi:hypothetical protein TWF102_009325 [Orbilia oligospora]|uniref:Uncharacterized protein n=1 Tax=Orbilia oligospora TaxID=2813651 RepID=A0A7C8NK54_ORBOL|nr:hypothetical protein TWF706_002025 [Orbilia oligospora]KAF3090364.1 hypothetical protein TWF102_009325 [Orbilia oligospora]KAF3102514.1 hypothetical protein TWF103_007681 [Orbilia oligospora]KAF3102515.1 hypothetical protein TWF103_007681 [Orbilia oligospora]KAF3139523.1 hypothetical protein TWF703_003712 [Orbilia oligospora]